MLPWELIPEEDRDPPALPVEERDAERDDYIAVENASVEIRTRQKTPNST